MLQLIFLKIKLGVLQTLLYMVYEIMHDLYEEKSLIKISFIQDSSTEQSTPTTSVLHATSNFNFHNSVD